MRPFRAILAVLVFAAGSTLAAPASADDEEAVTLGYDGGWYVMGGATGGGSFSPGVGGGFVGAEASVARLRRGWWYGVYSDAIYDFGQRNMTLTLGPEFGYSFFGVDGGLGLRPAPESGLQMGPQFRGLLTVGLVALYARYGFWPEATEHRHVRQFGIMLKIPLASPRGFGPTADWDMGNPSRSSE